ncbi:unnamed protein product [Urochloa decumbens]|uniref:Protein kinase domain-containing protein n=1 Tax=Urochloa decumbens TaxID=240449 RepID=A0ABC9G852_9POAL
MAATSFGVRLLVLFLFYPCCQRHALCASGAPFSNLTSGNSIAAVPGRRHDVVNTTVPATTASFFDRAPLPLWSKSETSWPSKMNGFSSSTLPKKYKGGAAGAASHDIPKDNRTSRTSVSSPPVASNRSAWSAPAPPHNRGARRRPGRGAAVHPWKARKPLCSFQRTASLLHGRIECSGVVVVVVVAGSAALLVSLCSAAVAALLLLRRVRVLRRGEIAGGGAPADPVDDDRPGPRLDLLRRAAGPRRYSYGTLAAATSHFAECRRIGRGGFGSVYRGYLEDRDRHVAVKTMFSAAGSPEQGSREFEAEVEVMSQLRHRNVVQLVGWYHGHRGLLLVYELVPGGSLHEHLHDPDSRLLTWPQRYKIALGLGNAILYLHTGLDRCVVHGDIKPSNVMLDLSGNAKLGDFGLARLIDHGAEPRTTQVVAGTLGYIDPEFVGDRRRGTESDVYSFGIALLEIACGCRPAAPRKEASMSMLLNRVRRMYDRSTILDAADERLSGAFDEGQMERVLVAGLWCADPDRSRRPSIVQAMDVLRSANSEMLPVLPAVARNGGCEEIRVLEERAYGDLSTEED